MATQYEKIRNFMKTNPAVSPQMREYAEALDNSVSWPATTTTAGPTTTSTTTTTTTSTTTTTT